MNNPLRSDVVLDLGTENTCIALRDQGVVLHEPSAVAFLSGGQKAVAAGEEAITLAAKNPARIQLVRPIRSGAVSDAVAVGEMIRLFMKRAYDRRGGWYRFRRFALVPVSSILTEVERRALEQAVRYAGFQEVWLEDGGWAAALGSKLPVDQPAGSMIVSIGAGTTMAAVYSMDTQVASAVAGTGADQWDQAIIQYIRATHRVVVNEETAREIKLTLADVDEPQYENTHSVRGRDLGTGLPVTLDIGATEIAQGLEPSLEALFDTISDALGQTPPELAADILKNAAVLCGGGALLRGLPRKIEKMLHIPVRTAEQPLEVTALGGAILLRRGIKYLRKKAGDQPGKRGYHG